MRRSPDLSARDAIDRMTEAYDEYKRLYKQRADPDLLQREVDEYYAAMNSAGAGLAVLSSAEAGDFTRAIGAHLRHAARLRRRGERGPNPYAMAPALVILQTDGMQGDSFVDIGGNDIRLRDPDPRRPWLGTADGKMDDTMHAGLVNLAGLRAE